MSNLTTQFDPTQQFLKKDLDPILDRPSRGSLSLLKKQLKANARKIHSTRGCGTRGHLRLCYTLANYNALGPIIGAGVPWVDPVHPGPNPIIPVGTTGPNIQRILQEYASALQQYNIFKATDQALLHQAMLAINETFYCALEDDDEGYADLELIDLIEHLDQTYGDVTEDDLIANEKLLDNPWSPTQPLEDLFKQARKAQSFARNHDPISDPKVVRSLVANLENSGVFEHSLLLWRARPRIEHTLNNIQDHFNEANKERLRKATTQSKGFTNGAANKVIDQGNKENRNPNNTLTQSLYYCWSHGLGPNPKHTSGNCTRPCKGHCKDATMFNMMGGNNRIHRRQGEVQTYVAPPFTQRNNNNNNHNNNNNNNRNNNNNNNNNNTDDGANNTEEE